MNEVQINKIKKRANEYATSCFPYEKQFLEREAVVKCCVHVVTETISELEAEKDKAWWEGFDTCKAKAGEANVKLSDEITLLKAQKKELQCCVNCRYSYGGEEEPHHDCGYCHAMQCICKLKLEEHTSDIYRMWKDKCERWEMRVN